MFQLMNAVTSAKVKMRCTQLVAVNARKSVTRNTVQRNVLQDVFVNQAIREILQVANVSLPRNVPSVKKVTCSSLISDMHFNRTSFFQSITVKQLNNTNAVTDAWKRVIMQEKNLVRPNATMDVSVKMDIHEARILFDVFHKRDIVSAPFWYHLKVRKSQKLQFFS